MANRSGTGKSPLVATTPYFDPGHGGCGGGQGDHRCKMWDRCKDRLRAADAAWTLCERPNVTDIQLMANQNWKGMLDKREHRLVRFLIRGMNQREIAEELEVSKNYVHILFRDLRRKLGAATNPQLVAHYLGHAEGVELELEDAQSLTEICPHCEKRLANEQGLAIHIGVVHPDVEDPALTEECPHCDKRFKSGRGLAVHIGKKHPEEQDYSPEREVA